MQLTVLGSNGTYATSGHPTSGYLVEHDGTQIWLDAGTGTFLALQGHMDAADLDGVVVSHAHVDHSADLFALYHYLRFALSRPSRPALFLPEDVRQRVEAYLNGPLDEVFEVRTPDPVDRAVVGGIELDFARADHSVPTLQVRFTGDEASLAYSADTGPAGDLAHLAVNADVLLAEATYQGDEKSFAQHLTAREAGMIATQAGVGRLVLTHILPTLAPAQSIKEAREVFAGEVLAAAPGLELEI